MLKTKIHGLYTALVTPFDQKGRIDLEGLKQNIHFQIENKVDGILVLGTTGESPTLSAQEKGLIIRTAVAEAKGKTSIMVGTGSYSTDQTIENSKVAQDLGADSLLVVTPYYNKPTQEGLFRHFHAIAQAVSLPIMLYNIQGRTGQNIQTDTLKRLAGISNICGVKEASGNITQIGEVIEEIAVKHSNFSVMAGDDGLTLPVMALGGDGIISVVSNLVPREVKQMLNWIQSGDYAKARQAHYALMPLIRAAFIETNPIPIKEAMTLSGMAAGHCRLPLCELLPENKEKLKSILSGFNHRDHREHRVLL